MIIWGFVRGICICIRSSSPQLRKIRYRLCNFRSEMGRAIWIFWQGAEKNSSIPIFDSFFLEEIGIGRRGRTEFLGRRRSGGTFHFYPRYPTSRDQKQRQRTELSRPSSGTFDLNELHIWVISAMKLSVRSLLIDR